MTPGRRRPPWAGFVSALALTLGFAVAARAAEVPRPAPSLSLRTAHGTVPLDSLRGKVVVVDFWASWCVPCQKSFPWLDAVQKRYADRGVVVVGINVDKSQAAADGFVAKHPAAITIAYDPEGRAAKAFGVKGMPTTFVVDRAGRIRLQHVGFDPHKTAAVESALEEACTP